MKSDLATPYLRLKLKVLTLLMQAHAVCGFQFRMSRRDTGGRMPVVFPGQIRTARKDVPYCMVELTACHSGKVGSRYAGQKRLARLWFYFSLDLTRIVKVELEVRFGTSGNAWLPQFRQFAEDLGPIRQNGSSARFLICEGDEVRIRTAVVNYITRIWPLAELRMSSEFEAVDSFAAEYAKLRDELLRYDISIPLYGGEEGMSWSSVEELLRATRVTENPSSVMVRKFQDSLRDLVLNERRACEITGIRDKTLLVASHIKPWAECRMDGSERLDAENILLLASNWDALFDRFCISFNSTSGKMVKSRRIDEETLVKFGVPADWHESVRVPVLTERRQEYLRWHNMRMEELDRAAGV